MLDLAGLGVYGGMFAASFFAATLLPAQSEAVLVGLLYAGHQSPWLLVAVASIGNILGSCVNWALGRYIERFKHGRWFPVSPQTLERASGWYQRYGKWSLLLSWVPVIGDPLTMVAGVLRERFLIFVALVAIGKVVRYAFLAAITLGFIQ